MPGRTVRKPVSRRLFLASFSLECFSFCPVWAILVIFFNILTLFAIYLGKTGADQTSVRSHSPDIADDINREIVHTQMRLQNMAGGGMADHTMTLDSAISMRNEELSNRSGSSDGSLNKRGIKSNVALQNKHL